MKIKIAAAVILFLFITYPCRAGKREKRPAIFGIVKTERTVCRRGPSINSGVIRNYYFGTPLKLVHKKEEKVSVRGTGGYWYQESRTKGWVFDGDMLVRVLDESEIFHFDLERIRCEHICGGNSCFYAFHPYILGDMYIATCYMNDYSFEGDLEFGIIVGDCKVTEDAIEFKEPWLMAGYDTQARYVKNILSVNFETKRWLLHFNKLFMKRHDREGTFYVSDGDSYKVEGKTRAALRTKCAGIVPDRRGVCAEGNGMWVDVNVLKPVTLRRLQNYFPLITNNPCVKQLNSYVDEGTHYLMKP